MKKKGSKKKIKNSSKKEGSMAKAARQPSQNKLLKPKSYPIQPEPKKRGAKIPKFLKS